MSMQDYEWKGYAHGETESALALDAAVDWCSWGRVPWDSGMEEWEDEEAYWWAYGCATTAVEEVLVDAMVDGDVSEVSVSLAPVGF